MAGQRLTAITVEGFTSIRSAHLELRPLNVLVGANGSGKSNFIRTFELIGRIVDRELGLFTGLAGGASNLRRTASSSPTNGSSHLTDRSRAPSKGVVKKAKSTANSIRRWH